MRVTDCWLVHGQVVGFELQHPDLVERLHQLTVDTYGAQHAKPGASRNIRVAYSLVGLHLALDRGLSGRQVRTLHQAMGRPQPSWPAFSEPPTAWPMTVLDVALAGVRKSSAEGHAAGVERWAAAVWNAWSPQRAEVVALADVVLASGAPANRKRAPRQSR